MAESRTPRGFTDEERRTWAPLTAVLELLPHEVDAQLLRDEDLTHFDYATLSMLALAEGRELRMTSLAMGVNATLSRLSHAVSRLEKRGFVRRARSTEDARATLVKLTADGHRKVIRATPGHVDTVRALVFDALSTEQRRQLHDITIALLTRLDPEQRMLASRMG
ncbi:MarR family transcriptional regulator [Microbacterium esteraromaticum]|uniref:MarR family winged helix-turn-helix transcriptional regulator n=1 Tax=Microbacterium esteraromaticum TaxID=57043 RepID=UPI001CD1E4E8|nr:MarR family transcriptional regulator [Microbacterium esteraromaticum]MCA1307129.1 MarR family transcriptional regulator [Microbacterium esteraromaticum]WDH78793.1 MarR family transcriptional regulator [Microbacterium esteraromaticum]